MNTGAYHWRDNWYFTRTADDSVWISKLLGGNKVSAKIPRAEWASIVAAVSAAGETGETYHAALALHDGRAADTRKEAITAAARWLVEQAGLLSPGPWAEYEHRLFYEDLATELLEVIAASSGRAADTERNSGE